MAVSKILLNSIHRRNKISTDDRKDEKNDGCETLTSVSKPLQVVRSPLSLSQNQQNEQKLQSSSTDNIYNVSSKAAAIPEWTIGQIVNVSPRTWPGINRPGGCGYIVKIHTSIDDVDGSVVVSSLDIKYIIHSGSDLRVPLKFVHRSCLDDTAKENTNANMSGSCDRAGVVLRRSRHSAKKSSTRSSNNGIDLNNVKPKRAYKHGIQKRRMVGIEHRHDLLTKDVNSHDDQRKDSGTSAICAKQSINEESSNDNASKDRSPSPMQNSSLEKNQEEETNSKTQNSVILNVKESIASKKSPGRKASRKAVKGLSVAAQPFMAKTLNSRSLHKSSHLDASTVATVNIAGSRDNIGATFKIPRKNLKGASNENKTKAKRSDFIDDQDDVNELKRKRLRNNIYLNDGISKSKLLQEERNVTSMSGGGGTESRLENEPIVMVRMLKFKPPVTAMNFEYTPKKCATTMSLCSESETSSANDQDIDNLIKERTATQKYMDTPSTCSINDASVASYVQGDRNFGSFLFNPLEKRQAIVVYNKNTANGNSENCEYGGKNGESELGSQDRVSMTSDTFASTAKCNYLNTPEHNTKLPKPSNIVSEGSRKLLGPFTPNSEKCSSTQPSTNFSGSSIGSDDDCEEEEDVESFSSGKESNDIRRYPHSRLQYFATPY